MRLKMFLLSLFLLCTGSVFAQQYKVIMETNRGTIELELFDETPKHRDNFVKLAEEGFYDGLLFHRVIKDFMIQGGDPESKNAPAGKMLGNGSLGYRVDAEFNKDLIHKKGALAAARDNNPEKASSSCQFYIVVGKQYDDKSLDQMEKQAGITYTAEQRAIYKTEGGTPFLDNNYTVFGQVTKGIEVVEDIIVQPTHQGDRPKEDMRIEKVTVVKAKKAKWNWRFWKKKK